MTFAVPGDTNTKKEPFAEGQGSGGTRPPKSISTHGPRCRQGHCKHHLEAHLADDWGERTVPPQSGRRKACLSCEWQRESEWPAHSVWLSHTGLGRAL